MRRTPSRSPRTSARERAAGAAPAAGFTLVELLVTMALLFVVTGAVLAAYTSAERSEAFVSGRATTLDELRLTVNRMTKEARQASAVDPTSTASRLAVDTYVLGEAVRVVYQVDDGALTRQQGSEPAVVLQEGVTVPEVFGYLPAIADAEVVTISITVRPPNRPETTVTVSSETRLRNRGAA